MTRLAIETQRDQRLKERGFDGLWNPDGECACLAENLYPCGARQEKCRPGVMVPCRCGEHDFHIEDRKEPTR